MTPPSLLGRMPLVATLSLRMPLRFLSGHWGRLTLAVLAPGLGVALVCAIDVCSRSVLSAFGEVIEAMAGRAALQVTSAGNGLFPEEIAAALDKVAGVDLAVPVVSGIAYTTGADGEVLTVQGVDTTNDRAVRVYTAHDGVGELIEDPLMFLAKADSIILTHAFARRRGLATDDQLILDTPAGRKPFTIRGLLGDDGIGRLFGGNLAVMDIAAAQAVFARPGFINRIDVVVSRTADLDRVVGAIADVIPAGLRVERPPQRTATLHDVIRSMEVALQAMSIVGLVAAFFIVFNRLTMVFEARAWQLAVMRAVGARRRVVWQELFKESLILGTIGVAIGIPLGMLIGRVFQPIVASMVGLVLEAVVPPGQAGVSRAALAISGVLGLGTVAVAAAVPAWRAAQVEIVETIRGRDAEPLDSPHRFAWIGWAAAALAALAAIGIQRTTSSPTWGLWATFLIPLAMLPMGRSLLRLNRLLLHPRMEGVVGPCIRFAAGTIEQSPRRMFLAVCMLGIGLGTVIWIWIYANSFERSLVTIMHEAARCDVLVTSKHTTGGHVAAPIDEAVLSVLAEIPGVAAAAGSRVVEAAYRGKAIAVEGFDPAYYDDSKFGKLPLIGRHIPGIWNAVAHGDAILVSRGFELAFDAHVGDSITLETPSGPVQFTVGGVTSFFEGPRPLLGMSRVAVRRHWHDRQVNRVMIRLGDDPAATAVREEIARRFGAVSGLQVLSVAEFINGTLAQTRRAFGAVHALGTMVLVVVLLGLADTLAASVLETRRQLATLRAIGARRRGVRLVVLTQGMLLGLLGLLLSLAIGLALAVLWTKATGPLLFGFALTLHLPIERLAAFVALTILVALAAGMFPAHHATRLEPSVALRDE